MWRLLSESSLEFNTESEWLKNNSQKPGRSTRARDVLPTHGDRLTDSNNILSSLFKLETSQEPLGGISARLDPLKESIAQHSFDWVSLRAKIWQDGGGACL